MEEAIITKDPVIGFLVVKRISEKGHTYIVTIPLSIDWEGYEDDEVNDIFREDDLTGNKSEIIGVLPAPAESYKVYSYLKGKSDVDKKLGYEFKGAYHPDWEKELRQPFKKL